MTLFGPRRPFITLQGLRIRRPGQAVEELVTDNAAVQSALVNAWRPVYTARATNADSTAKLLGYYQRNQRHLFNFSHLGVPDEEQFLETIIRAKHSAPGTDGTPFIAYKAIATTTARALRSTAMLFAQSPPPLPPPPLSPPVNTVNK